MASASTVQLEDKHVTLIQRIQGTALLKRKSRLSVPKSITMCLDKIIELGIKPEDIIK